MDETLNLLRKKCNKMFWPSTIGIIVALIVATIIECTCISDMKGEEIFAAFLLFLFIIFDVFLIIFSLVFVFIYCISGVGKKAKNNGVLNALSWISIGLSVYELLSNVMCGGIMLLKYGDEGYYAITIVIVILLSALNIVLSLIFHARTKAMTKYYNDLKKNSVYSDSSSNNGNSIPNNIPSYGQIK